MKQHRLDKIHTSKWFTMGANENIIEKKMFSFQKNVYKLYVTAFRGDHLLRLNCTHIYTTYNIIQCKRLIHLDS